MNNLIPTLNTRRLALRPFSLQDTDALYNILCEPGILQYFPNPASPPIEKVRAQIEHQLDHWRRLNCGWWAVVIPHSDELLGWCGLQYLPETLETELGYLVKKSQWGKGYATETGKCSLEYGFKTLRVKSIVAIVHPENTASRRVIEKLGFHSARKAEYFGMECLRWEINRNIAKMSGKCEPQPS